MKNAVLVHGWGGSPQKDWLPWAKKELEKIGFNVIVPEMPDTENPRIGSWVSTLVGLNINPLDENIFIGHSIGCQAILRFLERQNNNFKIDKLILIAPWWFLNLASDKEKEIAKPWLESLVDFNKIKTKVGKTICVFSDNDPVVPLHKNINFFKERLDVEIIIKENMGHFTQEEGITELPFLADLIK
jgi:hypothetical protein